MGEERSQLQQSDDAEEYPELVFGLVSPVGVELDVVIRSLESSLSAVLYGATTIRISQEMEGLQGDPWERLASVRFLDERLALQMKAGNDFRRNTEKNDAMALLAAMAIRRQRAQKLPKARFAYILRSLKRREEVTTLRRIYGSAFFLISAYAPRTPREQYLAQRISDSHHQLTENEYRPKAQGLILRDESESEDRFGQRVADTFALADLSVNTTKPQEADDEIKRFIELLFGHPFHTPSVDEQGMFLARAAAVRSASPARQVGAALCGDRGEVISLGTNEVPASGGGLYWQGDHRDARDFQRGHDVSDQMKRRILGDALKRLQTAGWLAGDWATADPTEMVQKCLDDEVSPIMKGAELTRTIDFVRAVHAEMAALLDAARRGASTENSVLYTTTFPCHDCAKHMVAAGVKRVVYVEPYPKSLAPSLCKDSMAFDDAESASVQVNVEQFVGVTPTRYLDLFSMGEKARKTRDGKVVSWVASQSRPILPDHVSPIVRVSAESIEARNFSDLLEAKGLVGDLEEEGVT